ncbi:oxidoreductase [Hypoxylon crocopeplum]|nr:oxidoreductase [Hypoxylon crocopeplum]
MADNTFDPDLYTRAGVITKSYYRDVYSTIDPARTELSQAGKVTIVTGAGRGIGVGIAEAHAKSGVRGLVLVGRSPANVEKVKEEILTKYPSVDILTVGADVADEKAVDHLFDMIRERFGAVDTLIHNAGLITPNFDVVDKVSLSVWWNDFNVNAKGTFLVNAAFIRLAKQNPALKLTVVNVVTNVNLEGPTLSSYLSSKAAVMKFTEVLQAENPELAAYTLNPGIVNTDAILEDFKPYAKDTPGLAGCVTAYLSAKRPDYLKGRHLIVNWDMDELEARKEEIQNSDMLKLGLKI